VKTFFKNTDATTCPIVACKIMSEGCKEEYKGKAVTMAEKPFSINAMGTLPLGFDTKVCVACNSKD